VRKHSQDVTTANVVSNRQEAATTWDILFKSTSFPYLDLLSVLIQKILLSLKKFRPSALKQWKLILLLWICHEHNVLERAISPPKP
jgi:hypothetical protein